MGSCLAMARQRGRRVKTDGDRVSTTAASPLAATPSRRWQCWQKALKFPTDPPAMSGGPGLQQSGSKIPKLSPVPHEFYLVILPYN